MDINENDPIIEKWKKEQLNLKKNLVQKDSFSFTVDPKNKLSSNYLKRVGGVDISASRVNKNMAYAALVVMDYTSQKVFNIFIKVLYEKYELVELKYQYVPGFLAFREVEHLVKLIKDLEKYNKDLLPEVIIVDGNGIFHKRGFGLACHLGVLTNIPTIGCSKSAYYLDGINFVNLYAKQGLYPRIVYFFKE